MTAEQLVKPMTETELFTCVSTFYRTMMPITLDKAIKIFELEFGFQPEIIEKEGMFVNPNIFSNPSLTAYAESCHFEYLYELQQSGATNMFMSRPYLQQAFPLDDKAAQNIVIFYMKNYDEIYFPERTI